MAERVGEMECRENVKSAWKKKKKKKKTKKQKNKSKIKEMKTKQKWEKTTKKKKPLPPPTAKKKKTTKYARLGKAQIKTNLTHLHASLVTSVIIITTS